MIRHQHLLAGSRPQRHPHPPPQPGRVRQPRHPGTPRELGHPQPDHPGRRQRQRHLLDHPRAGRRLHLHRRQQRRRHPGPGRHPGLPPPRHQRQHQPGRPADRRIRGLRQLSPPTPGGGTGVTPRNNIDVVSSLLVMTEVGFDDGPPPRSAFSEQQLGMTAHGRSGHQAP
jgi:hypothetical protein